MSERHIKTVGGAVLNELQRKGLTSGSAFCSFCGKTEPEVKHLHFGPGANISSECVQICVDLERGIAQGPE